MEPPQQPIFIGGAGRSGTTLVRVILDSHSNIACGPELKVTPILADLWKNFQTQYIGFLKPFEVDAETINTLFREFIGGLLEPLRKKSGKGRIAEKSPNNVFYFPHLHHIFPQSKFVHVVRDGRDVVASLLRMDWKGPDGRPIPYTQNAEDAAKYWVGAVEAARRFQKHVEGSHSYIEIKYEDLVKNPKTSTRELFTFLGEEWEEKTLSFHAVSRELGQESSKDQVSQELYQNSVGRWESDLSENDKAIVQQIAGNWLAKLGYL